MRKLFRSVVLTVGLIVAGVSVGAQADNDVPASDGIVSVPDDNDVSEAPASCGNGVVDSGEQCDGVTGINPALHKCGPDCRLIQFPRCGNHKRENAEECDGTDGLTDGKSYCDTACHVKPKCGNGAKDDGEECDGVDGVTHAGDECAPDCKLVSRCGNGRKDAGEECDGKIGITDLKSQKCGADCRIVLLPGAALSPDTLMPDTVVPESTPKPNLLPVKAAATAPDDGS